MRLWQKVFVCTFALTMAAIGCLTVFFLNSNYALLMDRERDTAIAEQDYVVANLKNRVLYERLKGGRLALDRGEVIGLLGELTDAQEERGGGVAVYRQERPLRACNLTEGVLDREYVRETASHTGYTLMTVELGSRLYLCVGSNVELEEEPYSVFTVTEITDLSRILERQFRLSMVLSMLLAAAVAAVLLGAVWALLRPLGEINRTVRLIARGEYQNRFSQGGSLELRELSENLNQMTGKIEENIQRLEDVAESRKIFIASLAHELKTPLTSILGFADVLRVKRAVSEEERREYSGVIVEETKRLKSLSGKLMELITMGSTELDFQPVDLSELVEEARLAFAPLAEKNGVTLRYASAPCRTSVDVELMKSLLYNLLENAVKASPAGGEITLACRREFHTAVLTVADHGIGMSPEVAKNAFEPFFMANKARSRKAGGAGLGLALCAEICRVHRGKIGLQSSPGAGTTVTVTLPGRDAQ